MKTQISRNQTILITVTIIALFLSGFVFIKNRSTKNQLQKEKMKSESMLSENLNLQKSIEKLKKDMSSLQDKNAQLDKTIAETYSQLELKESEIKKLRAGNASVADLKKKNAELEVLHKKLQDEIASLNLNKEQLAADNKKYSEQIDSYKNKNEELTTNNALLEAMLADNYRIEAQKRKNEKLTVSARRTNKLMTSFDIPTDAGQNLYFKIVTPDGKELSSINDKSAIINISSQDKNLIASLSGSTYENQNMKRAELIYKPQQKLTKGIYRINVFNGQAYIGSIQIRLK
jgi:DNA repair exonuclease SbcCD ATPase subunit